MKNTQVSGRDATAWYDTGKILKHFRDGPVTAEKSSSLDLRSAAMLALLAAIWGGSFFFVEIALQEVPPVTITLHRVFWAVPVLGLIVRWQGIAFPTSLRVWGAYMIMGALNNAIPFSLIIWAQVYIESGLAAILNGTTAVFAAVIAGALLSDERLSLYKLWGAVLGLIGVAFIMGPSVLTGFDPRNLAQLAMLGAAVSYSFASVWGKTALSGQPPLMNAFGMVAASSFLMIPIVVIFDGPPSFSLSLSVWAALLGIAILSTAVAYMLYFATLVRAGAANLMLVTLLIPPFAIVLGAGFLGEQMRPEAWAGVVIIALGFAVTDGRIFKRRSKS